MKPEKNKTLAHLVITNPLNMLVFERYGLDYCCHGNRTLEVACLAKGILPDILLSQLEQDVTPNGIQAEQIDFTRNGPIEIIQYILNTHHAYVKGILPAIEIHLNKTWKRHHDEHPELDIVQRLFHEIKIELEQHMLKEEVILFPYIIRLEALTKNHHAISLPIMPFVSKTIRMMESEHLRAGEMMAEMRQITNHYTPPVGACSTYTLVYRELHDFELDLHRHVHIENNILFPKSLNHENSLLEPMERI